MQAIIKMCALAIASALPLTSYAGVETELLSSRYKDCHVRISHDVVAGFPGTILFRSFKSVDGIHYPCAVSAEDVTRSLDQAFAHYLALPALAPASSIMIGRLVDYPWARQLLEAGASAASTARINHEQFNAMMIHSGIARPFARAIEKHGYVVTGASCEKLMFYANGAPQDGLCWLIIEPGQKVQ